MKQFIVNKLGEGALHPSVVQLIDYAELAAKEVNRLLSDFERWQLVLASVFFTYVFCSFYNFYLNLDNGLFGYLKASFFRLVRKIPLLNAKIKDEIDKNREGLEEEIVKANRGMAYVRELPTNGMSEKEVMAKIDDYLKLNCANWNQLSGCVYGADDKLTNLTARVYEKFAWTNPLHADVFPNVRKMEAEVVRMTLNLFHGDEKSCGTMTSGGTESIMLACKAYRDRAFENGIKRPEMVVPETAHAAFDKAAHYFRIKIRHVSVDPKTKKVNLKELRSCINSNTCMIAGSTPQYPHGAVDPIEEMSKIAVKYNVPLHVDACLGGYLIVFMEEAGYKLPLFDFRLEGVTSISCDTHKYAYTPKGSSVIMYRDVNFRKFQFFSAVDWQGGIYASPTFSGSRAGSLIAMTWATLMYHGHSQYVQITKNIIEKTRFIANEIKKIPELRLMCEPEVSVVSFESSEFNVLNLLDDMATKGWTLTALQTPPGIHFALTKMHTQPGVAEKFVEDLKCCVKELMTRSNRKMGKTAAIYCSTQKIPDKSIVSDVVMLFLDACYSTKNANE